MADNSENQATQTAILIAANECFEENGVRNTSLSAVADKAGVSVDELKSMYSSKNLLALAVQTRALEEVKQAYLSNMPDASLEEMIKFIIRTRCEFAEKNLERTTLFFHSALKGLEPWSQMMDELVWQLSVEFASLFEKSARTGEIKKDANINIAVRSLTSFYLTGILTMGLRAEKFESDVIWDFIEPQIDLLLEGLRK